MSKFEMLRDSLFEVRKSIEEIEANLAAAPHAKVIEEIYSDALELERQILAEMERTE